MKNEEAEWETAENRFFKASQKLAVLIAKSKNKKLQQAYNDYLEAFGKVLHHLKPSTMSQ